MYIEILDISPSVLCCAIGVVGVIVAAKYISRERVLTKKDKCDKIKGYNSKRKEQK